MICVVFIFFFFFKLSMLPCEKENGTEEELEHKRVMAKASTDSTVMKDDR